MSAQLEAVAVEQNVLTESDIARRTAYIAGLREMAQFLEDHPTLEAPYSNTCNVFVKAAELPALARLTAWTKEYFDTWFALSKSFSGNIELQYNVPRNEVCRKVVTGTRIVAAREAEPEHVENVEEWVCDDVSLLKLAKARE